jgi:hypothetical protein
MQKFDAAFVDTEGDVLSGRKVDWEVEFLAQNK